MRPVYRPAACAGVTWAYETLNNGAVGSEEENTPRVVVVIVDGLPLDIADDVIPGLPFLGPRLAYRSSAISCFPSTTGPAYFPLLAGCTPGRANVPGIRWFDRTRPRRSAFPHRGLRGYVGPDARRLATDTNAVTDPRPAGCAERARGSGVRRYDERLTTERRRSRTDRGVGCTTARQLAGSPRREARAGGHLEGACGRAPVPGRPGQRRE